VPYYLKRAVAWIVRLLFPSALLAIHEKGIRRKLRALFRHELQAHSTPLKLSVSLSLGVFMAIVPIHGFQVLLLLLLTSLFRLNRPVAMVGVSISTAPFLPFWIAAGVGVGELCMPAAFVASTTVALEGSLPSSVLAWINHLPVQGMLDGVVRWFFGSIILAVVCGAGTLALSYPLISHTQALAARSRRTNESD